MFKVSSRQKVLDIDFCGIRKKMMMVGRKVPIAWVTASQIDPAQPFSSEQSFNIAFQEMCDREVLCFLCVTKPLQMSAISSKSQPKMKVHGKSDPNQFLMKNIMSLTMFYPKLWKHASLVILQCLIVVSRKNVTKGKYLLYDQRCKS